MALRLYGRGAPIMPIASDDCKKFANQWKGPVLGAASLFVVLFAALLIVLHLLSNARREAIHQAEINSANLASILKDDLGGQLDGIDILLRSAEREIERQLSAGGIDRHALNDYLKYQQSLAPQIISLRMVDAKGKVVYGPNVDDAPPTDVSDRPYFARHRDASDVGMFVDVPMMGHADFKAHRRSRRLLRRGGVRQSAHCRSGQDFRLHRRGDGRGDNFVRSRPQHRRPLPGTEGGGQRGRGQDGVAAIDCADGRASTRGDLSRPRHHRWGLQDQFL